MMVMLDFNYIKGFRITKTDVKQAVRVINSLKNHGNSSVSLRIPFQQAVDYLTQVMVLDYDRTEHRYTRFVLNFCLPDITVHFAFKITNGQFETAKFGTFPTLVSMLVTMISHVRDVCILDPSFRNKQIHVVPD